MDRVPITGRLQNSDTELEHFDQSIFEVSQAIELSSDDFDKMFKRLKQATREDGLEKAFKDNNLDAMIGLAAGPAWLIDHVNGDSFSGLACQPTRLSRATHTLA